MQIGNYIQISDSPAPTAADDAIPLHCVKLLLGRHLLLPKQGASMVAGGARVSSHDNVLHAMLQLQLAVATSTYSSALGRIVCEKNCPPRFSSLVVEP